MEWRDKLWDLAEEVGLATVVRGLADYCHHKAMACEAAMENPDIEVDPELENEAEEWEGAAESLDDCLPYLED
jgi:hypothetical protein